MRTALALLLIALASIAQDKPLPSKKAEIPGWLARHQRDDGLWPTPVVHSVCGRWAPGRCGPVDVEAAPRPPSPLTEKEKGFIDENIEALAADEFEARENATQALLDLGSRAASHLRVRSAYLDDLEAMDRVKSILKTFARPSATNRVVASSSMAILAYLGAGYTHLSRDVYGGVCSGKVVESGLKALVAMQQEKGEIADAHAEDGVLAQALASFALSEVYSLTSSERWRSPAQEALSALARLQGKDGGWPRGSYETESDPLTTHFAMAAIKSAEIAEIDTSAEPKVALSKWVNALAVPSKMDSLDLVTLSVIAMHAALMLRYRGDANGKAAAEAIARRAAAKPAEWDAMDHYLVSFVLFSCYGPTDNRWKDYVRWINSTGAAGQIVQAAACDRGSWSPKSALDRRFGPVWCTALYTLSMEVFSRTGPRFQLEWPF